MSSASSPQRVARFQTPAQAIVLRETVGIDGTADHPYVVAPVAEIFLEMSADHVAIDHDQGRPWTQVLFSLQTAEGAVGRVDALEQADDLSHQRMSILVQVAVRTGAVQAALGIKHILSPGLVEADGDIVLRLRQSPDTGCREEPGLQESWTPRHRDGMIVHVDRQSGGFPAPGIEMDLVTVGT